MSSLADFLFVITVVWIRYWFDAAVGIGKGFECFDEEGLETGSEVINDGFNPQIFVILLDLQNEKNCYHVSTS